MSQRLYESHTRANKSGPISPSKYRRPNLPFCELDHDWTTPARKPRVTIRRSANYQLIAAKAEQETQMSNKYPKVETLDGWPERGKSYRVRCVRQVHCGRLDWWPVWTGAMHDNFDGSRATDENGEDYMHPSNIVSGLHYHTDPRFLSDEQMAALEAAWNAEEALPSRNPEWGIMRQSSHRAWVKAAFSFGISAIAPKQPFSLWPQPDMPIKSEYRVLTCRVPRIEWDVLARDEFWPVKPISLGKQKRAAVLKDGRPTCPHNGMDLTVVWDGQSATVRCPLHGLLVDMNVNKRGGLSASEAGSQRGECGLNFTLPQFRLQGETK